jgi:hypothetical protein
MKLAITFTLAAMTLLAASMAPAADSILVSASPARSWLSLDQKATNACFNAFLAQLLPGSSALVRTIMAAGSTPVFTSIAKDPLLAPYKVMDVGMSAAKAQGAGTCWPRRCRVDRNAKVLQLDTHITDTAKLAGLTLKDIKLAMTNR